MESTFVISLRQKKKCKKGSLNTLKSIFSYDIDPLICKITKLSLNTLLGVNIWPAHINFKIEINEGVIANGNKEWDFRAACSATIVKGKNQPVTLKEENNITVFNN